MIIPKKSIHSSSFPQCSGIIVEKGVGRKSARLQGNSIFWAQQAAAHMILERFWQYVQNLGKPKPDWDPAWIVELGTQSYPRLWICWQLLASGKGIDSFLWVWPLVSLPLSRGRTHILEYLGNINSSWRIMDIYIYISQILVAGK